MSAFDSIGDMTYGELLASLRKDLQLDATTDILAGTILASLIDQNGRATFLQVPTGAMTARARAMSTTYQPNANRLTLVIVTFNCANTGNDYAAVLMDAASPPTTEIGAVQGDAAGSVSGTVTFLVPPGFYYRFNVVAGGPTIRHTYEYTL